MEIVEWIGFGVVILLLALAVLFTRREMIGRGGSIELSLRLTTMITGRGWSPGIARFAGDDLKWYKVFSFSIRPRRTLSRRGLAVQGRRAPNPPERLVLPEDWVVLRCVSGETPVEIAMAETTLTGFLSWLEASPPGAASNHVAAR
jgi:hypothetical protein